MNLDIQAIADSKIKEMQDSGEIKKRIEEDVEKTVLRAIDDSLNGYELRDQIKNQITHDVSETLKDIDFTTYNGFIAEQVKSLTEGVLRDDVAQKIQKDFNSVLIQKHDGIKLSEIFDKYREWVNENTEESDKYDRQNFVCKLDEKEDDAFTHYTVIFNDEEMKDWEHPEIKFSLCRYRDAPTASIGSLWLDGEWTKSMFKLGRLSTVQALIANLYYNGTKIILDIDNVDDSDGFDIDD